MKLSCLEQDLCKDSLSVNTPEDGKSGPIHSHLSFDTKEQSSFGRIDSLNELKILRMITKPVYIMAQYIATFETSENFKKDTEDYNCKCIHDQENKDFHFCPANSKFMPSNFCREHIECNDPINVCFDLAKLCSDFGQRAPEYGNECKNISNDVINFSVDLLQQCSNSKEVEMLLRERAGLTKYMRFVNMDVEGHQMFFKYPRLTVAVELNFKEFVGHMHCQQILRQTWYFGCDWERKSLMFKVNNILVLCFTFCITFFIN